MLLPPLWVFDFFMSFEYFIGKRYLRARQKQTFISLITFLSISCVTVGGMALMVVIAVMSGFESDLKARILRGQPHIMVMRHGGSFTDFRKIIDIGCTTSGHTCYVTLEGQAFGDEFSCAHKTLYAMRDGRRRRLQGYNMDIVAHVLELARIN